MMLKELRAVEFSLRKVRDRAAWKGSKEFSDIFIFLEHFKKLSSTEFFPTMFCSILGEYLCSCVFRGNRFKKECVDRNRKTPVKIGCIPFYVAELCMEELGYVKK